MGCGCGGGAASTESLRFGIVVSRLLTSMATLRRAQFAVITEHVSFDGISMRCESYCEDVPCAELEGDAHFECGACHAGASCNPQAAGFPSYRNQESEQRRTGSTTDPEACKPWCMRNKCADLKGHVNVECGACATNATCHPGAPGYSSHSAEHVRKSPPSEVPQAARFELSASANECFSDQWDAHGKDVAKTLLRAVDAAFVAWAVPYTVCFSTAVGAQHLSRFVAWDDSVALCVPLVAREAARSALSSLAKDQEMGLMRARSEKLFLTNGSRATPLFAWPSVDIVYRRESLGQPVRRMSLEGVTITLESSRALQDAPPCFDNGYSHRHELFARVCEHRCRHASHAAYHQDAGSLLMARSGQRATMPMHLTARDDDAERLEGIDVASLTCFADQWSWWPRQKREAIELLTEEMSREG